MGGWGLDQPGWLLWLRAVPACLADQHDGMRPQHSSIHSQIAAESNGCQAGLLLDRTPLGTAPALQNAIHLRLPARLATFGLQQDQTAPHDGRGTEEKDEL